MDNTRNAETFWMVKGDGPCSVKHECRNDAVYEAKRLANANPGKRFYVLKTALCFERKDSVDTVPFAEPDVPGFGPADS